ncbi:nucleolar protein 12 [Asbolus verrucosus]|uniref:Nucleolar protein 12 n=1 Tax=Asbolus verrucosus TaxID=1661398 RepID=A0A482VJX6_ASBVE|nr:nucleolar protein 12 [Asbolus verrucosus]
MAAKPEMRKSHHKNKKNRAHKVNLVFDEAKRRDFLTGFHKRKLQRKKEAREKLELELKNERKRLKTEAKESYKKLVVSSRSIPELETLLQEQYEDDDVTVKIEELSTNNIALQSNWIGANQPKYEKSDCEDEETEEIPGMELTERKKREKVAEQKFNSERDVKRLLKKEATKKVKKSKVFQMKNKIEKQKQKKKSMQLKKQRIKLKEKKSKKIRH